jgi:flagellar basal-body rod protein FlgG
MERALWSAVTGMHAQELAMDTIANNLANINTTSFKSGRLQFQDMLYSALTTPGAANGDGEVPTGIQVGHGTRVASTAKQFTQGALVQTDRKLDVAIEGDGFFEVALPDGTSAFSRDGSFSINSNGEVVTSNGYRVVAFDSIDSGTTEINIAADGSMTNVVAGASVAKSRLSLARFVNPEGLRNIGRNLYQTTDASGEPLTGLNPGEQGVGALAQGYLEGSNVNAAAELVNMITTQRAYEASSKAIKASDEMMDTANNLRR